VQVYIARRKFDIRLYAYVPGVLPLGVYAHSAGLARFCTREYVEGGAVDELHLHLTDFAVNRDEGGFVRGAEAERVENAKWSLAHMRESGVDADRLMREMERVAVAVIAGVCEIRKVHRENVGHRHTAHEMYGMDLMIDEDLIEINISPSMNGADSQFDYALKIPLNLDVLRMGRIIFRKFQICQFIRPDFFIGKIAILFNSPEGTTIQIFIPKFRNITNRNDITVQVYHPAKFRE
jgi:tubulin polyglutamylase TTLL4